MSICQSTFETRTQAQVDSLTTSCSAECLLEVAIAANNANADRQFSLALACDLPDLATSPIPRGTTVFVEELGIPVYTNGVAWKGMDGRTYRTDITAGTLYSAGYHAYGQLMRECTTQCCFFPTTVGYGPHWIDIGGSGCDRYVGPYGIKSDGTLWSWGFICNAWVSFLNCGSGAMQCSSPVQEISSSNNWVEVAGGLCGGAARKTDGTLWYWGTRAKGDNTNVNRSSPVQEITSSTNWCKMSASDMGTAAIKSDNTLWYFGANCEKILSCINVSSPVQEYTSSSWCDVSLRSNTSSNASTMGAHAIKTDGTLWGWGASTSGVLGNNNYVVPAESSPVQEASGSTSWCIVSAGKLISGAIKTDGTLWAWGTRPADNTLICRSSPVQEISSSTTWCGVSAHGNCTALAIKTDGTLWGWGPNICRTLADGTVTPRSSPVQEITNGTNWYYVNIHGWNSYALKQA